MKIWIIQTGEPFPSFTEDRLMRTGLLVKELLSRGHKILWWTSSFDHFRKKWIFKDDRLKKINESFTVIALKGIGYSKNSSMRRFIDHRIIANKFLKHVNSYEKPDLILGSMPPYDCTYNALKYSETNNVPIVVDLRDCWPENFLKKFPCNMQHLLRLSMFNEFKMVKNIFKKCNAAIFVTQTFLKWAKHISAIDEKKCLIIPLGYSMYNGDYGNTKAKFSNFIEKNKNKFIVSFIGTFGEYHNPHTLVECAKKISNNNIIFVLGGDGEKLKEMEKLAEGYNNIFFPGWLNEKEIDLLLSVSSVGVCATKKKSDLFPNKAYAYLAHGIPVLSSFEGDLSELIKTEKIGLNYKHNDSEDLEQKLIALYENKEEYTNIRKNANKIFQERFDAKIVYSFYADFLEKIINQGSNGKI